LFDAQALAEKNSHRSPESDRTIVGFSITCVVPNSSNFRSGWLSLINGRIGPVSEPVAGSNRWMFSGPESHSRYHACVCRS